MGSQSYSAIVSIGAVEFDTLSGETGREFYRGVSLQSSLDLGLVINADTLIWWLRQNEDARNKIIEGKDSINQVLLDLAEFVNKDCEIWGNSARFDLGLLQNAYNKANLPIPWDFRRERCVRTLVSLNPTIQKEFKYEGTAHDPISDCKNQIAYCSATWNSLKNI